MRLSETEINVEHTDRRVCVKRSNTTRPPLAVFGRAVFGPRNRYVEGVMYWLSETSEWMMQVIICLRTTRHWKWKHKEKETAHTAVDNVPTTFLCLSTCTNTPSPRPGTQQSSVASFTRRFINFWAKSTHRVGNHSAVWHAALSYTTGCTKNIRNSLGPALRKV